jgi:NAD(P)-dependent dehydrogenase (short-subunit alcohol dehydrogenase family)
LAREGARVLASDIDLAAAEETARAGESISAVRCDVSQLDEVERLGETADRLLGGVDLIVNNAGVAVGGRIGEVPIDDWRWILGINLWGVIHGCHVFVPRLRRQRSGHVINVASAAGLVHLERMGPYNVTKAGVVALSETLASELRGEGVGVSVLCPSLFRTNIWHTSRVRDPEARRLGDVWNARARRSADDVASAALEGARAGQLHLVPHADGRWLWRLKRVTPDGFQALAERFIRWQLRQLPSDPTAP